MKLKVLAIDIGGCEGCTVSILRALPQIESLAEVHCSYLGNLDLGIEYDVALVSGSVCVNYSDAIEKLKKIREISKIVVAFGSCAAVGGITRFCRGGQEPAPEHCTFQPISSVIDVDYAVPGCPPPPQLVQTLLISLTRGSTPMLRILAAVAKAKKLSGFDLIDDVVLAGICVGCGACVLSCPTQAIHMVEGRPDIIVEKCIRCGTCYVRCPRATSVLLSRYEAQVKTLV